MVYAESKRAKTPNNRFVYLQKKHMIKSMTGYGKSHGQLQDKSLSIEIKCLNSKYLDIHLKVPALYKSREQEIRSLIGKHVKRGKAELVITLDSHSSTTGFALNKALMEKYYRELIIFAEKQDAPLSEDIIPAILRLPEVVQQEAQTLDEDEWQKVADAILQALDACDSYRQEEGRHMEKDLKLRTQNISGLLEKIPGLDDNRKEHIKQKLVKSLEAAKDITDPDSNRFEQELLYYLEKLDITEEVVRLEKHLSYFTETLAETDSAGKKLGFIAQEIGREINTIGSKANDASMQKIVVQMKDELEKIKEQLMNVL